MLQVRRRQSQRARHALFLDIGVESVKQQADVRMADLRRQFQPVGSRVQEVCFEAVQRLDGDRHPMRPQRFAERLITLNRPPPLVIGPPPSRQIADRRIQRTGDQFGTGFRRHAHAVRQVASGLLSNRGVLADRA